MNEGSEDACIHVKANSYDMTVNLCAHQSLNLRWRQANDGLEHKREGVGVRAQGGELDSVVKRDGVGGRGRESLGLDDGVIEINAWLALGAGEDGIGVI